jgi:molybdopterin/thiamine biosynthesis adenylyltransferase
MRLRLNGWQRLGIVLSVIAFVGFAGYAVNVLYYDDREDVLQGKFAEVRRLCEEKLKDPSDPYSSVGTLLNLEKDVSMRRTPDSWNTCSQSPSERSFCVGCFRGWGL